MDLFFYITIFKKNVFYENLAEYYKMKPNKKPSTKYVQSQMINEIVMPTIRM